MSPVIEVIAPRLLAPAVILAAALIVKGYTDVGEGFSAGVVVALAVGLRYVALGRTRGDASMPLARFAPAIGATGLLIALGHGFFGVLFGEPPFTHLPRPGEEVLRIGSLELTTAVGFDVGLFLLVTGSLVALVRQLVALLPDDALNASGESGEPGSRPDEPVDRPAAGP